MKQVLKKMILLFYAPLLIAFLITNKKIIIRQDILCWAKIYQYHIDGTFSLLLYLLANLPEYRSLFYYRLNQGNMMGRLICRFLELFYKGQVALFINCQDIGPGLFIQHGFSTIISAKKIGQGCWINQQVTIGYNAKSSCPTIGNNVFIYAGAKVLGGITVGDNAVIGANAVVVKNVPENCTVVGIPARIVRRNGQRVSEDL